MLGAILTAVVRVAQHAFWMGEAVGAAAGLPRGGLRAPQGCIGHIVGQGHPSEATSARVKYLEKTPGEMRSQAPSWHSERWALCLRRSASLSFCMVPLGFQNVLKCCWIFL